MLIAKLVPPNEEATHFVLSGVAAFSSSSTPNSSAGSGYGTNHAYRNQKIFVRPVPGWKGGLARARLNSPGSGYGYGSNDGAKQNDGSGDGTRPTSAGNTGLETQDEPQEVLNMYRKDMIALWHGEGVRDMLKRRKSRPEKE